MSCVLQGVIGLVELPSAVELCLAPVGEGSLQVHQATSYQPRLAAGSVAWQLQSSVQLPAAFQDGVVHMIAGDAVVSSGNVLCGPSLPPVHSACGVVTQASCHILATS